jgi:hypothetical protein
MDIDKLFEATQKEKECSLQIDEFVFEYKILDGVELGKFVNSLKEDPNAIVQIDILFKVITNFKNVKAKHLLKDPTKAGYEPETEVPFSKKALELLLGKHNYLVMKLYDDINVKTMEFITQQEEQKKT